MYNKKYIIEKIEEFGKHNDLYDGVEGSVCYLAYLNVGERGWFLYEANGLDLWFAAVHRVHTSTIQSVDYLDDKIIVDTRNTRLTFRLISE